MKITIDRNIVSAYGDTVYCSDEKINRGIGALPGMAKYTWSTGETTPTIIATNPGKFYVIGETPNFCKSKDSVIISQFTPIQAVVNDTIVCPSVPVDFDAKVNVGGSTSVLWSNGATTTVATITNPGQYWLKITVGLCSDRDTFQLKNFPNEFELGKDLRFCDRIDTTLTVTLAGATRVVWNKEVIGNSYKLTQPGTVVVELFNSNNCPETDSISVALFPNPALNLGGDTTLCLSENPILDAGANMISYIWNTGATTRTIVAYDSGIYWVKVKDVEGCVSSDSINMKKRKDLYPSTIFMPNAFTPNNDGRNDFYPLNQYKVKGATYNVKIYNRWGEKIMEMESPDINWDGTINGKPAPEGVYVFTAYWIGCDNEKRSLRGNFTLLR
ncbi:MAG: T9SS type B sorting domain-containing protein [Sphingomonadales bacterium]|nr:T9SS type B sorting domain-containing protein [Sphingomonadales bacterium]